MIRTVAFYVGRKLIIAAAKSQAHEDRYGWGGTAWTGKS